MNDFFLANNESLTHTFIDHEIQILQIQVKNLNQFAYYAEPIKNLENYSVEMIQSIIDENIVKIMGLCSLVTTLNADTFSKNIDRQDVIVELVLKIIHVNKEFFKKEEKKKRKKNEDKQTWFDSFTLLTNQGHTVNDIYNMSYGAFCNYLKAANRYESQRLKSIALTIRAANHSKQNDFEKFLSSLMNNN